MKTVVLLSGGLDSSTVLSIAVNEGYEPYALSFRYGQRHKIELDAAKRIAKSFNTKEHIIVDINLRQFGGSALTDNIDVPKDRSEDQMGIGIPITYVPARNTIFLSYALAWAEVLDCRHIHIGVNILDYSGYPDCRPEFVEKMNAVCAIANYEAIEIVTPYLKVSKTAILTDGLRMGLDYNKSWTCYNGRELACGKCGACQERLEAFRDNNATDPLQYES